MTRTVAFLAMILATLAALGSQCLSYGLVYPAAAHGSKLPLVLALLLGSLLASLAGYLSFQSLARARVPSERFVAILGLALSGFFLFVVIFGFGIPDCFVGLKD